MHQVVPLAYLPYSKILIIHGIYYVASIQRQKQFNKPHAAHRLAWLHGFLWGKLMGLHRTGSERCSVHASVLILRSRTCSLLFQGHGILYIHPQIQSGFHKPKEGIILSGKKIKFPSPVGLIGILTIARKLLSHIELEKENRRNRMLKWSRRSQPFQLRTNT